MAIVHTPNMRSIITNAVTAQVEVGSAGNPTLEFLDVGGTILATLEMQVPAFDPAVNGVAQANSIAPDSSAANSGVVTHYRILNRDGVEIYRDNAGTGGTGIVMSSASITAGDTVTVSSLSYTTP